MVGDAGVEAYNAAAPHFGGTPVRTPSQFLNEGLNKLGFPNPQTTAQELFTAGTGAAASMVAPANIAPWMKLVDQLKPPVSQGLLNSAWSKAIGEDSTKLDTSVLQSASDRMGSVFDSVRDETPRTLDTQQINNTLGSLDEEFQGMIGDGTKNVTDHPLVQKMVNFANQGTATGEQLGKLSSQLGKVATKQFISGDPDLGSALSQVKDITDDAVQQGLSPAQQASYATARSQYRAMMQLLRSRSLNVDTGDVNPTSLGSYLQTTDRQGYAMGNNTADHYMMTHAMRGRNASSSVLNAIHGFQPAGVPVGPLAVGAWNKGLVPPVVKAAAGGGVTLDQESQNESSP
jgi:hypothetical protein